MNDADTEDAPLCLTTHARTITETDIVNFVDLVGLHEPHFIDIEWVKEKMPETHKERFAPAPFLISLGMGLAATSMPKIMNDFSERRQPVSGRYLSSGRLLLRAPRVGCRLEMPGSLSLLRRRPSRETSLVDPKRVLRNQRDEVVAVFTERIIFGRREEPAD